MGVAHLGGLLATYTALILKNKPCPIPVTARPTINMDIVTEPASKAAPIPNTTAPIIIAYIRPSLSARAPARKEAKAAGIRIVDTIRPCKVDDTGPKDSIKDGIVVMGPIVPVSRLRVRQPHKIMPSNVYSPKQTAADRYNS